MLYPIDMNFITKLLSVSCVILSGLCTMVFASDASEGQMESIWVSFEMRVPTSDEMGDAKGFGLILVDQSKPKSGDAFSWDEPNMDHSIAIGFDVHNPQPTDLEPDENGRVMGWFDEFGNWYDRPQREISVHANGRERLNILSPIEYRTGEWIDVMVQVRFVLGGAHVTVMLDGEVVIDDTLWGVHPLTLTPMAGRAGKGIEHLNLEVVHATVFEEPLPDPIRVGVFDAEFLANAARLKSEVDFSETLESVGRVIATMTLGEPEVGYDHWDKKGTIGIYIPREDEEVEDERFEVFRFITPYRRGWTWYMDVTDLLPLFKDERTFDAHIGTYMKGLAGELRSGFLSGRARAAADQGGQPLERERGYRRSQQARDGLLCRSRD